MLGHFCLKIDIVEKVKVFVHVTDFELKGVRTVLKHILVSLQSILTILDSHLHLVGDVSHNTRLLDCSEVAYVIAKELLSLCVHLCKGFGHCLSLGVIESPSRASLQRFILSPFYNAVSISFCEDLLGHYPSLGASVVQAFSVIVFLAVSSLTILVYASHRAWAVA